jgi:predicted nucleic acid-binding protein
VAVKWYIPEPGWELATRLLHVGFDLHVPDYFYIECASLVQRKVAVERTVPPDDGLEIRRLLRQVPLNVHATEALLDDAYDLAVRYRRPVYDSLYLVLAQRLVGQVVTADARLFHGASTGPLAGLVVLMSDPL